MAALDVNNLPWIEANLDIVPLEDIEKGIYDITPSAMPLAVIN